MILLQTTRLDLCLLTKEDAAFTVELLNSPSFIANIGDRKVRTKKQAWKYLKKGPIKSYSDHGFGMYVMKLRSDSTAIGMCGLVKREELEDVDIGFALLPEFEGKGYALEASAAVMELSKTQFGLKRIAGITVPENVKSIRLLEKLGLRFEKTIEFGEKKEELSYYLIEF